MESTILTNGTISASEVSARHIQETQYEYLGFDICFYKIKLVNGPEHFLDKEWNGASVIFNNDENRTYIIRKQDFPQKILYLTKLFD